MAMRMKTGVTKKKRTAVYGRGRGGYAAGGDHTKNGNGGGSGREFGFAWYADNPKKYATVATLEAYKLYAKQGQYPSPRYRVWLSSQEQGGEAWKAEKLKFETASNNAAASGLSPYTTQFKQLRAHLWIPPAYNPTMQNPYAGVFEAFVQFIMDRGSLLETGVRPMYNELRKNGRLFDTVEEVGGEDVYESGMALDDEFPYLGASPDIMFKDGCGEIKCQYSTNAFTMAKVHVFVTVYYMPQIMTVMRVFKRPYCDFTSYGRLNKKIDGGPLNSVIVVIRVYYNEQYWDALQKRLTAFIDTVWQLKDAGIHELSDNTMLVIEQLRSFIGNASQLSKADISRAVAMAASKITINKSSVTLDQHLVRVLCNSGITDTKFNEKAYNPSIRFPLNVEGAVNMYDPMIRDPNGVERMQHAPDILGEHIQIRTRTKIIPNIDDEPLPGGEPGRKYGDFTRSLLIGPDISKLQYYMSKSQRDSLKSVGQ